MDMRTVEHAKVFPLAPRSPLGFLNDADHVGSFCALAREGDRFHRMRRQWFAFPFRLFFPRRLQNSAAIRKRIAAYRSKNWRILIDDGKSTLQNRRSRTPVLSQHN